MKTKTLSRERMYVLLKYYREMTKEIQSLYPSEEELIEKYRKLDEVFKETMDAEAKYQAGLSERS